jgi:hypothetical protein
MQDAMRVAVNAVVNPRASYEVDNLPTESLRPTRPGSAVSWEAILKGNWTTLSATEFTQQRLCVQYKESGGDLVNRNGKVTPVGHWGKVTQPADKHCPH